MKNIEFKDKIIVFEDIDCMTNIVKKRSAYENNVEKEMNKGLGLSKDWAYNIIKSVGNYGEVYDKYMGFGKEGIGIARKGSPNDLWTRGGLMYSPPFR